jgi:hypothetical protein
VGWISGAGLLPPAGHGGEGSELYIASSSSSQGRSFFELNHVDGILALMILCWQGGMPSTFMMEALGIRRWSSMLPHRQVVRPLRLVAASGCSSTPEGGRRALCLCSSAETPGGCRRLVVATLEDVIALYF